MSDERLRELERRWSLTGEVEDESALVAERQRTGRVELPHLRLAAVLGSPAARKLLPQLGEHVSWSSELVEALCADLRAGVRAALTLAAAFFRRWANHPWIEIHSRPALDASRDWARCPCLAHAQAAWSAAAAVEVHAEAANDASTMVGDWWSYEAVQTAHYLAALVALEAGLPEPTPADPIGPAAGLLAHVCRYFMPGSEPETIDVLREELVPWLLGHTDPLRSP